MSEDFDIRQEETKFFAQPYLFVLEFTTRNFAALRHTLNRLVRAHLLETWAGLNIYIVLRNTFFLKLTHRFDSKSFINTPGPCGVVLWWTDTFFFGFRNRGPFPAQSNKKGNLDYLSHSLSFFLTILSKKTAFWDINS